MHRSIVHVLLSLLLLLAQQASMLHVASDWGGARTGAQARVQWLAQVDAGQGAKRAKLPGGGPHEGCALCMDSAQLAFALPLPTLAFAPLQLSFDTPPGACDAGIRPLASCVVQPRGPPQA